MSAPPDSSPSQEKLPDPPKPPASAAPAKVGDAGKDWEALRKELGKIYFYVSDDPDAAAQNSALAEAVLAYEMMSGEARVSDAGKQIINKISSTLSMEEVAAEWNMLYDHKKQIFEAIKSLFNRPTFGVAKTQKVAYAGMKIRGQQDLKEVCFVPEGMTVPPHVVSKEVLGKKHWKLPIPNMMIKFDCGTRHPSSLSTPQLLGLPAFNDLKKTALASVHRNLGTDLSEQKLMNAVQNEIDELLKISLAEEIVPAVLDASKKTKNWIVIDRSNPTASSPSAELMLELALTTAESKPTIFVYDSFTRYASFRPSRRVNMQLLLLGDVLSKSASGDDGEISEIDKLYDVHDFGDWKPYHVRDPLVLTDDKCDQILIDEGDRRLPRKAEEVMIQTDDVGRKKFSSDGRPLITPQVKWLYHYRQYLFNAGTHYVIFENAAGSVFSTKSSGVQWPEGKIFAHGGNLSFDRIQQSLSSGTATVMLYNTGGVTQTFGSLHQWCVSKKIMIEDECIRTGSDSTREILDRAEVVSREPWTKKFGVSVVLKMQRLEKRAPEVMRKSVVVVDTLRESPEQVVEKVTGCFASGGKGLPELGLGSAEEDVVLNAWQTHMTFTKNGKRYRAWGDMFFYVSVFLTLVSSNLAVLVTEESYTTSMSDVLTFDVAQICNTLLLLIPIISSIVGAVISKRRLLQKWAAMKAASAQIVAEIYKFRTVVIEYDPRAAGSGGAEESEEDGAAEGGADAGEVFNSREVFVKRYQEINKFALDAVGDDSLKLQAAAKLDLSNDQQKELFKQQLRKYVPREVLGGHMKEVGGLPSPWSCFPRKKSSAKVAPHPGSTQNAGKKAALKVATDDSLGSIPSEDLEDGAGGNGMKEDELVDIEPDDFVSPMTIETYIEYRSKQLLKLCEDTCPPLAKKLSDYEMLVILSGATGTLLSALGFTRWVAVTVSFATVLMNIIQHQCLHQRLSSFNTALRELNNTKILMDSLSIVSKRTQEMKTLCVGTVENAMLETTTAWTGVSARPSAQVSESKKDQ